MRKLAAVALLLVISALPGCWDAREMNELGLVIAAGVDKAADSNAYILTVQIANAKSSSQQSTKQSASSEPYFVLSSEGETLFDATRDLIKTSSKRIMWAHNFIVIIGESVARDSIAPVIDYFTHNPELRMKTPVVVSKGNAMDYVALKSGMEDMSGESYADIYGYSQLSAEYIQTSLLSLAQSYYGEYSQPLVAEVSMQQNKTIPGEQAQSDKKDQVQFGGSAVFRKDRMVGWLSPDETKGLAWVLNGTKNTLVTVPEPSQPNRSVSVETNHVAAKINTRIEGGQPSVTLDITGSGSIVEEDGTTDLRIEEYKKAIEGLVDKNIADTVRMGMEKIQKEYRCDVLGLAKSFHAQHFREWESQLKAGWKDVYPQIPVTVNVNINIVDSTLYQIPEQEITKD